MNEENIVYKLLLAKYGCSLCIGNQHEIANLMYANWYNQYLFLIRRLGAREFDNKRRFKSKSIKYENEAKRTQNISLETTSLSYEFPQLFNSLDGFTN